MGKEGVCFFTNRNNRRPLLIREMKPQSLLALIESGNVNKGKKGKSKDKPKFQYIKVTMTKGNHKVYLDEILVNPKLNQFVIDGAPQMSMKAAFQ